MATQCKPKKFHRSLSHKFVMNPIPDTRLWGIQEVSLSQLGKVWVAPFSLSWSLEWAGLARLCLKRFKVELQTKWGLKRYIEVGRGPNIRHDIVTNPLWNTKTVSMDNSWCGWCK